MYRKGFTPNYFEWTSHGEELPESSEGQSNEYREMVLDALGHNPEQLASHEPHDSEEEPNAHANQFLDMLKAFEKPWVEGSSISRLEMAYKITALKCEYNLLHR